MEIWPEFGLFGSKRVRSSCSLHFWYSKQGLILASFLVRELNNSCGYLGLAVGFGSRVPFLFRVVVVLGDLVRGKGAKVALAW